MEALQAKKRAMMNNNDTTTSSSRSTNNNNKSTKSSSKSTSKKKSKQKSSTTNSDDDKGYDSGDSYDSGQYIRTKEDDDFIDTQGEDEDLVREYYAEQHFDDERPDELEEMEYKPRKKGSGSSSSKKRGPDSLTAEDKKDKDNPILQVVERMKKKKKTAVRYEELKENAVDLISKMQSALIDDELSMKKKQPGLKKLQMLPHVLDVMVKQPMMRPLLESDFLTIVKKWIEPLENGTLGNVTLRERIIDGITKMNNEGMIENDDLKRSEFGKLVMTLYMHTKETPEMKRKLKVLIEQWSRRIFGKTGDLKYLRSSQAQRRSEVGLVGIAKAQAAVAAANSSEKEAFGKSGKKVVDDKDLGSILANGVKQARDLGRNRVRVPYSKGFQFTVQPEYKTGDVADKKTRIASVTDQRESLHKRMLEKKKKVVKNSRSSNISIEGRPTK